MKTPRAIALFAAAGILAACGPSQPALNPPVSAEQGKLGYSERATAGALMYAGVKKYVEIYTFPEGAHQETFRTTGFVNGMCSDAKGNIFIAAAPEKSSKSDHGYVYEYAHGGTTAIATLDLPKNDVPLACSVDPVTGNLAVTAEDRQDYAPRIAIYARASGTPKVYTSGALGANPQGAYDKRGDLFATSGGNLGVELLKGATGLSKVTLARTLGGVRHVQWGGTSWALQSFDASKHQGEKLFERIYRVQISGSTGQVVGTTDFNGWPEDNPGQSWIQGGTIVATPRSEIEFWAYPAGGKPVKTIHPAHSVKAVTISTDG